MPMMSDVKEMRDAADMSVTALCLCPARTRAII